jgi:hypothetical protein
MSGGPSAGGRLYLKTAPVCPVAQPNIHHKMTLDPMMAAVPATRFRSVSGGATKLLVLLPGSQQIQRAFVLSLVTFASTRK